jgi:lipopolysaccharide/colanic/teichoic acid biosynthesis glycosyltransferase
MDNPAKRAMDVALGLVLVVLSLPLQVGIAGLVKIGSPGPVLYRADRTGLHGKRFTAFKFRTMRVDADRTGPRITANDDQRITRSGHWLRESRLDELPQLWNVLVGQMSLVGPRPEDPHFVAMYTPEQRIVLSVRPGLTGPAQLMFRSEASTLDFSDADESYAVRVLPRKLAVDMEYVRTRTFLGDLVILVRTAVVLTRVLASSNRRRHSPIPNE